MPLDQPDSYRGNIPFVLYLALQNKLPQIDGESDSAWLRRLKSDPTLIPEMFGIFGTPQFKKELNEAVRRRAAISTMAAAGAKRYGFKQKGKDFEPWAPAQRYHDDAMLEIQKSGKEQAAYAKEAYEQLLEQFDPTTPVNGSVFWNGINELALVKKIDQWNNNAEIFAQLEATTAARYVNKKFVWEPGPFKDYFTTVSGKLAHQARGHVTLVCRCGLRYDSILTTTELPAMLDLMAEQIVAKKEPNITDITIVVIDPKLLPIQPHATFTNKDITNVSIVRPIPGRRIGGRNDCTADGQFTITSGVVRDYLAARLSRPESAAATRIKDDLKSLVTWP